MGVYPLSQSSSLMTSTLTSDSSAQPEQFRAYHEPALELDVVRHGLILNALAQVNSGKPIDLRCWTLGEAWGMRDQDGPSRDCAWRTRRRPMPKAGRFDRSHGPSRRSWARDD